MLQKASTAKVVTVMAIAIVMVLTSCSNSGDRTGEVRYGEESRQQQQTTAETNSKYREAPMLSDLVDKGQLPPVSERLPAEPMVVKPSERIGQYGGVWRTTIMGAADNPWFFRTVNGERLLSWTPDWSGVRENIVSEYEVLNEGRTYVLKLRRGIKWSDGKPVTSDDIMFWYEDVLLNADLLPVIPAWLRPGGEVVKVTKVDERTVRFDFAVPNGLFLKRLAAGDPAFSEISNGNMILPAHYLKKFHIKYNKDWVESETKRRGMQSWTELWKWAVTCWLNPELPTLNPWIVKVPLGEGTEVVFERNPFYWKIDPEGNQLPYLDRVVFEVHNDVNSMVVKALNGEIDMQDRHIATNVNKPVFAENMERGNYRFFEVRRAESNAAVIALNLTHKDPILRRIFQDKRFRIALSLGINRKQIIDAVYVGQSEPWQVAPLPETPYYNERLAKQYTEYDPEEASSILDEMGLSERDAKGVRLRPDGKPLIINIEFPAAGPAEGWPDICELVAQQWRQIGVGVNCRMEDRSLFYQRKEANEHDATIWVGDGGAYDAILMPRWYFPFDGESNFALPWATWFNSNGEAGEEPPEAAKRQMELYRRLEQTVDEDEQTRIFQEILDIAAEEFWVMGIAKFPPGYGIVRNDFHNVPEVMWGSAVFNNPFSAQTYTFFTTRSSD